MEGYGANEAELSKIEKGSEQERLRHFHEWQLETLTRNSAPPVAIAAAHLPLGEIDRSFEWLEVAYQQRSSNLLLVGCDPRADIFGDDPRLLDLIERIGLPFAGPQS